MPEKQVSSRISRDIVNLFVDRGMTITQLAKHLGVTKSYVSRVKSGARSFTIDHLEKLEHAVGAPLPLLLIQAIPRKAVARYLLPLYDATRRMLTHADSRASMPRKSRKQPAKRRLHTTKAA